MPEPLDLEAIRARVADCDASQADAEELLAAIDRVNETANLEPHPQKGASQRQEAWATGFRVAMYNIREALNVKENADVKG